jgi:hypothetical protein
MFHALERPSFEGRRNAMPTELELLALLDLSAVQDDDRLARSFVGGIVVLWAVASALLWTLS